MPRPARIVTRTGHRTSRREPISIQKEENMDFQVGDKVKVEVNGKEYVGLIEAIRQDPYYLHSDDVVCLIGGKVGRWCVARQLTRVEPPKPPESQWLLPVDEVNTLQSCVECTRKERLAQLRHVVEMLRRQNKISEFLQPSIPALFLYPDDWARVQKAAGL